MRSPKAQNVHLKPKRHTVHIGPWCEGSRRRWERADVESGQAKIFEGNNAPLQGHLMNDVSHYPRAMQVDIPIKLLDVDR